MADLPSVKMKKRANLVIMAATLIFAIMVIVNLFNIMVINSSEYQKMADDNQFGKITIPANRGSILSSDGKILAQSATVFRICLDPSLYQQKDKDKKDLIINFLTSKLDSVTAEKIIQSMEKQNSQYQVLAYQVEKPLKNEILQFAKENDIVSIFDKEDTKRYYPQDDLAAAVIGHTDSDGIGQYGVEATYDDYLSGVDGVTISAQDAFGDEMPYRYSKLYEAKDGNSVVLTLDTMIQYYVESALNNMVEKNNVTNRACAIVMNAKTGAILAMATSPGYDLNNKTQLPEKDAAEVDALPADQQNEEYMKRLMAMWNNKAISCIYEPGSVFKVFTSAAALEEKVITLDDSFECSGSYTVLGTKISCWQTSGHGSQKFMDALRNSCNPAFMQIGLRLTGEKFSYYADAFGFREKTGIDLPGETNSYFASPSDLMNDVTLATSAFGQTNTISPIQMVAGYASVINGGYLVQPHVVDRIVDNEGNTVKKIDTIVKRQVISDETSAKMRQSLQYVVDNNGGSNVYIKGYRIGGKSGTSEKLTLLAQERAKRAEDLKENPDAVIPEPTKKYIASYCCFAPADNPEIVMLVMADQPEGNEYYGSKVAVPCAREIFTDLLPYLGYYPEYTVEEQALLDVPVPNVESKAVDEAEVQLKDAGFEVDIRGTGETVVAQVPTFINSVPKGSKIILYTQRDYQEEEKIMPDLMNMTADKVASEIQNIGLNVKFSGSENENAKVIVQSYPAGTKLKEGTIVSVQMAIDDRTG
ncbi:MAG: penicillin-binding transpeptidase domain-containing protein [Oscillospiraceae bacterium]|nr:penicillin-binding transpeptidase domain-containing protein [Oscillospiraceae bacterium]